MITIDFQGSVWSWLKECFGKETAKSHEERNHRFIEEALELVQSCGYTREDAHRAVDYVFDRDAGELEQEVGGVLVCLAALCSAHGTGMVYCGNKELTRICDPEIMKKIRRKHANKPDDMRHKKDKVQPEDDSAGLQGVNIR